MPRQGRPQPAADLGDETLAEEACRLHRYWSENASSPRIETPRGLATYISDRREDTTDTVAIKAGQIHPSIIATDVDIRSEARTYT
ncbi:hypothetical protein MRX96_046537 [Rhipicephalus microplus]